MRVRVVNTVQVYWNYAVQTLNPPLEVDGELARHLADNAPTGSIEVIDEDRKEARAAAARAAEMAKVVPPPPPEDPKNTGAPGDGSDPQNPEGPQGADTPAAPGGEGSSPADPDAPPMEGTAQDLFDWIDGDQDKAARALEAEQAKDKPRSTVVKRLSAMAGTENA